ncbi:MAG TPA: response regulator [Candidatus Dormibacteraeota bacterium]
MRLSTPQAIRSNATVLIADDEPSMRLLVRATIESDQYEVLEAGDGEEAWDLIRQYKPSVILLDVQMPGRTGLEVLALIRSDPSLKATRVIMLTAKALKADMELGLTAGADLYLTKPFSPLDLLTLVDEALGQWQTSLPPGTLFKPAA